MTRSFHGHDAIPTAPPTPCASPSHRRYSEALEGLYLQTWMASRDLVNLLEGAPADAADARAKGADLYHKMHKLDEVTERIAFGVRQLAEAEAAVNRHFDRGCRNLAAIEAGHRAAEAEAASAD